ncbi:porin [Burkholderia sp. TJI49]|nr:porin [Burkholderia sp. TJI49]
MLALTSDVYAQSSITLFGAVDANVRYISYSSGHGSAVSMGSFGGSPSFFGLLGKEDLGNGYRATFRIDAGFVPATGQSAVSAWNLPFFDRSAWVGLESGFGTLHFGRDWSPTYTNMWTYDPTYNLGVGNLAHLSNLLSRAIVPNYEWNANSITYYTPQNRYGVSAALQVALRGDGLGCAGNDVCSTTIGSFVGARIAYDKGPFEIAAALGQTGITHTTVAPQSSGKWTQANLGASYDFKFTKLMLALNDETLIGLHERRASIGVQVPVGVNYAWASYGVTRTGSSAQAAGLYGAQAFALGFVYNLSKTTSAYASVAYLRNAGNGTLSVEDVNSYTTNTPPGGSTTGVEIGIRTAF